MSRLEDTLYRDTVQTVLDYIDKLEDIGIEIPQRVKAAKGVLELDIHEVQKAIISRLGDAA